MNKLFLKVGAIVLGAGLVVGSGVAIAARKESFKAASAAEVVAYTLDGTDAQTDDSGHKASGYATSYALTQDSVSWEVYGNTTMNPWRIGGKSLTNVDRTVYSKSAVSSENISKVELTVGTASSITVNSLSLVVSTEENGEGTVTSTVTETFAASSKITFARPNAADWSNKYFKFIFTVTVSGTSNKFVQFIGADFIYNVETVAPDTITVAGDDSVVVGDTITLSSTATKSGSATGVNQNVIWSSSDESKAIVSASGVVTGINNGTVTIKATSEDSSSVFGTKAITVTGAKTDDSVFVLDGTSGLDTSYGDKYKVVSGVYMHYTQVQTNNGALQFQKNAGILENVTPFYADIDVIELTFNSENLGTGFKVYSSEDGTNYSELDSNVLYSNTAYYVPAAGSRYFKVTASTNAALRLDEILVGLGNTTEEKMLTLVSSLNTLLDAECSGEEDNTPLTAAKWEEIAGVYASGDADAKTALAGVSGRSYLRVNHFLERYDYVVTAYGYTNFLNRTLSSHRTISLVGNNNVVLIAIIASSLTVISAVALVFVLKRKKHN